MTESDKILWPLISRRIQLLAEFARYRFKKEELENPATVDEALRKELVARRARLPDRPAIDDEMAQYLMPMRSKPEDAE